MNPCSYGWNVSIWDFIRDAVISEEFRDITWRLLKELPELPWVSPFVRGSDFLPFSVLLTLTPVASSSLFTRDHHLVTQPRLAAFLNGCDLYLSLASLLYVSHNRLKNIYIQQNTLWPMQGCWTRKLPLLSAAWRKHWLYHASRMQRGDGSGVVWWRGLDEGDSAQGPGWRMSGVESWRREEILHTCKWQVFKQNLDLHPRLLKG